MNRKNPNTTLVFCPLRVIPVVLITIAIVIIVSVVVTVIVIYIVINISNAVLFFIESWYFAIGIVEVTTAENKIEEDIFEDMLEAEIMEQPDRPRLLAAGFPGRSFVDPNTPSRSRPIGYLGQKWVNFLYGKRNFCQQSISPVCLGLQFSHSDLPKKKSVTELGIIFQGSTPFLALLGLCRFISISTLNFGPFSTKLGGTVRTIKKMTKNDNGPGPELRTSRS